MNKNIKAELVLASKSAETGIIIYTFKLTFPRFILSEVNTHTIASKNTASSRAIPTKKMLSNLLFNPFIPSRIGQYKSGMQAGEEITGWRRFLLEKIWSVSRYTMLISAFLAWRLGAPKQFSNRLLEPWAVCEQIWTSTDVRNEILLRDHPDAEPHYEELARQKNHIIETVERYFSGLPYPGNRFIEHDVLGIISKCQVLQLGQWHKPFEKASDIEQVENLFSGLGLKHQTIGYTIRPHQFSFTTPKGKSYTFPITSTFQVDVLKYISCARCAWVSYEMPGENSDKMNNILSALITYHKLILSNPKHLSPTQHVATPLPLQVRVGNFIGWFQHRKEILDESGGDPVVVSITPEQAKALLKEPNKPLNITLQKENN